MQLLFLSNLYPPYALGGYEQWCQEVAIALAERGHTVDVLTARVGAAAPHSQEDGVTVHRQLHLEVIAKKVAKPLSPVLTLSRWLIGWSIICSKPVGNLQ